MTKELYYRTFQCHTAVCETVEKLTDLDLHPQDFLGALWLLGHDVPEITTTTTCIPSEFIRLVSQVEDNVFNCTITGMADMWDVLEHQHCLSIKDDEWHIICYEPNLDYTSNIEMMYSNIEMMYERYRVRE